MSNQFNSFSSPINEEASRSIEKLNLSIIQKHHIRLLAHCLAILKDLVSEDRTALPDEKILREWCRKESEKINDHDFGELLYSQMYLAAKKLHNFSKSIGKTIHQLNLDDLINLTEQANEDF